MTRMGKPFQRFRRSFQETTSIFGKDGIVQTHYFDLQIPIHWLIIKRSKYFKLRPPCAANFYTAKKTTEFFPWIFFTISVDILNMKMSRENIWLIYIPRRKGVVSDDVEVKCLDTKNSPNSDRFNILNLVSNRKQFVRCDRY